MGLRSGRAGTPAARACKAWALPISPPPAQAAALLDMFWGLNGETARPRRAAKRQSPATIRDLPALEAVPWIMMARMGERLGGLWLVAVWG